MDFEGNWKSAGQFLQLKILKKALKPLPKNVNQIFKKSNKFTGIERLKLMSKEGNNLSEVDILEAPNILEYPYSRSTGPVIGEFMTKLRDGKIVGARTKSGKVIVPPTEYDPFTSEDIDGLVPVSTSGVITSWAWVVSPSEKHPLSEPFAWALIKLDGADSSMLHCVRAPSSTSVATGKRVKAKFRSQREGHIKDIEFFEIEEAANG